MIDPADVRDWEEDLRSRFPGALSVILASVGRRPTYSEVQVERAARLLSLGTHRLPCEKERAKVARR
ncbi:MAG: hypothetical protein ACE141_06050 [Bryobacteraceae bacterium]